MATKFDIYEEVTNKIIAALEAGTPPWRKPWTGERGNAAFPLRSNGESYRGINVIMLWLTADERGYTSPFWFTYRQAQELGGQVRKGEKSARVVKYGTFEKEGDNGEERKIGYLKSYSVFNADQIADLPEEYYRKPEPARDIGTEADPELEAFFDATGLDRISSNVPQAYYNTANDQIHMPPIETFHDPMRYYFTLAHEAAHATGHEKRLDRFKRGDGKSGYALEELVAEISSCMTAASIGLKPEIEQSAAYVKAWLAALQDDKKFIFKAASEAQKATDWLLNAANYRADKLEAA